MTLDLHPLCTLFPRLAGAEFSALVDDIEANGLRQPITLLDGMVLDGGNRYRACIEAGVQPTFVEFAGSSAVAVAHTRAIEAAQAAAARVRRSVYNSMQHAKPGATLRLLVEVYPDESGDPHITARRLREGEEVLTPAELAEHVRRERVAELRRLLAEHEQQADTPARG